MLRQKEFKKRIDKIWLDGVEMTDIKDIQKAFLGFREGYGQLRRIFVSYDTLNFTVTAAGAIWLRHPKGGRKEKMNKKKKKKKMGGLQRCGRSCRLRWLNYLRPDIKRGNITPQEECTIIDLHGSCGSRSSLIAETIPGRTDNEINN
ncbi:hypothetical protein SUGI_0957730 [Cryptomeria japonica]|nr:hypothetical protein SUGI_0957730 [Cryptomeria japonica]